MSTQVEDPRLKARVEARKAAHEIIDAARSVAARLDAHEVFWSELRAVALLLSPLPEPSTSDLLAACQRMLTFEEWKHMLGDENRAASYLDAMDKMRAAIRKATVKTESQRFPVEIAAEEILRELCPNHEPGTFTVGHDQRSTIFVYEHKRRHKYTGPIEYKGFRIVRKYIGKIAPAFTD